MLGLRGPGAEVLRRSPRACHSSQKGDSTRAQGHTWNTRPLLHEESSTGCREKWLRRA